MSQKLTDSGLVKGIIRDKGKMSPHRVVVNDYGLNHGDLSKTKVKLEVGDKV